MRYLLFVIALQCADIRADPLIGLPVTPALSQEGRDLIVNAETGGESYYNRFLIHPEWPGGYSGITAGIGYDLSCVSSAVFWIDWHNMAEPDRERLVLTVGLGGQRAKARLAEVRDIIVAWDLAEGVFNEVDIPRFWQLTRTAFPGFDNLRPNAQASLASIVFNRGSSMAGPGRVEMREIARLSPKKDYAGMAAQIRAMKRLWIGKGQDGLLLRREAEAKLMESCITKI
jgi:hypothetical protein